MRTDTTAFADKHLLKSRSPQFIACVDFGSTSYYLTSSSVTALPPGVEYKHGSFKVVSSISQSIDPKRGRATIGSVSFEAVDLDNALSTKIRACLVAGEGLRGKAVRFYQGYPGLRFPDFVQIITQVVDSVDLDGTTFTFHCKDITREAQTDIFKEVSTTLGADLAIDAVSMTVASTTGFTMLAHGTSYSDAASSTAGYLEIKQGDRREVMRYTGMTANSFTGLTRGVLNTQAQAYTFEAGGADNGVKVRQYVYLEMPAVKLAYALLTGELLGQDGTGALTYVDADDQGDNARGVWSDGDFIYLANYTGGLHTYSADSYGNLTHVDSDDQGDKALGVWGDGNFIYLANGAGGLHVYSSADGVLTHVDSDDTGGGANSVWGDGRFIYVANGTTGLHVYSVSSAGVLEHLNADYQGDVAYGVWGDGNFVYLANGTGGLHVYSISSAAGMTHVDSDDQGDSAYGVWGDGNFVYLANTTGGLHVYSVDGAGVLTHVDSDDQGDSAYGVWGDGHFVYLANSTGGLHTYSVSGAGVLTHVDSDDQGGQALGVFGVDTMLFLANNDTGLLTYTVDNIAKLPDEWHLAVDKKWVNKADFLKFTDLYDIDDDSTGIGTFFESIDRQDGKTFIERELMLLLGCYLRVQNDGRLGIRRSVDVQPGSGYVDTLDISNIVKHGNLQYVMSEVSNEYEIQWNWNVNKKAFTRLNILVDATSQATHGEAKSTVLSFRGLNGTRHSSSVIQAMFDVQRDRYSGPPIKLQVTCLPSKSVLEVGDPVRVVLPLQDFSGTSTLDRTFEIQRMSNNWVTGEVTLDLFASSQRAELQAPSPTSQIADAWYSVEGTEINAANFPGNVSSAAGLTTISGNITLTGTADMNAAASVFYVTEDCTIAGGVVVGIAGNVQLRVKGFLTLNGDFDGVGDAGTTDGIGYVGSASRAQDGMDYRTGTVLGYRWRTVLAATPTSELRIPLNETLPYLSLVQDANGIVSGIPKDLRGTDGQTGGDVVNASSVLAAGGAGGLGGAGLFIVSRGGGFGGSGGIDLSGTAGVAGAVHNTYYHAGAGSSGGPGACYWILDGASVTAPTLSANFTGRYGAIDLDGSSPEIWENTNTTDITYGVSAKYGLNYAIVNGVISDATQVDISAAAQRLQRVAGYVAAAADVDPADELGLGANWSEVADDNGGKPDENADVTSANTAAAIAGQGALATKGSVDLATGEVTNKTGANITYTVGGVTVDSLKPAAAGADPTASNTAAAIAGQGALATKNLVDLATGEVTNKTGANITYTVGGVTVDSLKPAAAGADPTASNTAAAIAGQGALATKNLVDLATGEVTNKTGANITYTVGGVTVDSLKPAAAGADPTASNTAAAIAGQGALATLSTVDTDQIAAAAVQTAKIEDNAVTVNSSGFVTADVVDITTVETSLNSLTYTATAVPTTFLFSAWTRGKTSSGLFRFKLYVQGVWYGTLEQDYKTVPDDNSISMMYARTPTAGSCTVEVKAVRVSGSGKLDVFESTLLALETKK